MKDLALCQYAGCRDAAVADYFCFKHDHPWYREHGGNVDMASPDEDLDDDPYWFRFIEEEQESA
jgi:hypothetical protein